MVTREALRLLLIARQELTTASTAQTNRLRALLHSGEDTDRQLARGPLTDTVLTGLARRRAPRDASREQAVRHAEIRRLTFTLRDHRRNLSTNRAQLLAIVNDLTPRLTDQPGIGPVSAALERSLTTTNPLESMISITRTTQRNVKNWKDAAMARRWTAAGMLAAQAKFRRIRGYKDMPLLLAALARHTTTDQLRVFRGLRTQARWSRLLAAV
jgi:hypothetical protein